jgi:hypothetical protein
MELTKKLKDLHACDDAIKWVGDKELPEAWATCERGDWMLWLYARSKECDLRKLTLAKGLCAKLAEPFMIDQSSIDAVNAAIRFGRGEIELEELNSAAYAAYAAVYAADSAASAVYAAHAAVYAVYAADSAASAVYAAHAAIYAASAAKRAKTLHDCAEICRQNLPIPII